MWIKIFGFTCIIVVCALTTWAIYDSWTKMNDQAELPPPQLVPVVQNEEVFELTLYSVTAEHPELLFQPYPYHGVYTRFSGTQRDECNTGTHRFMLLTVGNQPNIESVREELIKYGELPCGQWIEAFRFRFPLSDGLEPVGVADPSWNTSVWAGTACTHPMLADYSGSDRPWRPHWMWCNHNKFAEWRWLVQVD